LGASRIPLRGVAKRSFLQAFDVGRAAAARIAEFHCAEGTIDSPEDIFYFTVEELTGHLPADPAAMVVRRRERRTAYQGLATPSGWTGQPTPQAVCTANTRSESETDTEVLVGVGVSAGVVEGIVRVVLSPDEEDIRPDEILVAPFTDPSWSSLLFISAGLIVDIGGALSHAAVVAREMDIPCIVNTRTGTSALRTGDRVKMDGTAGTIQITDRAAASTLGCDATTTATGEPR
jgi:rifampicin phosphotransferase